MKPKTKKIDYFLPYEFLLKDLTGRTRFEISYQGYIKNLSDGEKITLIKVIQDSITRVAEDPRYKKHARFINQYYLNTKNNYDPSLLAKTMRCKTIDLDDLKMQALSKLKTYQTIEDTFNLFIEKYNPSVGRWKDYLKEKLIKSANKI